MINLDQVRTLEWKVKQAVQLVVHLRRENDTLRGRLSDTEVRLQELETLLDAFKATQNEMESGIRSALEELDNLEGAEAVPGSGPVDLLSYPPVAEASEPEPEPEPTVEEQFVETVSEMPDQGDPERSFEEEFAALAAEEAATLAAQVPESAPEPDPIPESVELEPEAVTEAELFEAPAAPAPVSEEREPEQPGLGIF